MIKYKLKQINRKPELHDKEFIVYDDVLNMMDMLCKAAIDAGADSNKLEEFFVDE